MELVGIRGLVGVLMCLYLGVLCVDWFCHRYNISVWLVMMMCVVFVYGLHLLVPYVIQLSPSLDFPEQDATDIVQEFNIDKIYIIDSDAHNAAVLGRNSVVYTSKSWNEASKIALVGVTAHEKGHLIYQHMLRKLLYMGLVGGLIVSVWRLINAVSLKYGFLVMLCVVWGLGYIQLQRTTEHQADRYALDQGYATGLIEYFDLVLDSGGGDRHRWIDFLYLHDSVDRRITFLGGE